MINCDCYCVDVHAWTICATGPYGSIPTTINYKVAISGNWVSFLVPASRKGTAHPCKVAFEGSGPPDWHCFQFGDTQTTSFRSGCSGYFDVCKTSCEVCGSSQR